jgi:tetraacyldisaccharide 4'-kinase
MAGIAGPERFGDALGAAGWMLAGAIWFPDHHRYRRRDVDRVAAIVRDTGAEAVLTTEKDAMRLLPLRPLPVPIAAVPLGVEAEPAGRFRAWLLERIDEARR